MVYKRNINRPSVQRAVRRAQFILMRKLKGGAT